MTSQNTVSCWTTCGFLASVLMWRLLNFPPIKAKPHHTAGIAMIAFTVAFVGAGIGQMGLHAFLSRVHVKQS